jgi:hypothetical protein
MRAGAESIFAPAMHHNTICTGISMLSRVHAIA